MNRFLLLPFRLGLVLVLLGLAWSGQAQTITTFDMPNSISTQPNAINMDGQIAGTYVDAAFGQHGFLRKLDGTLVSFDAPPPSSPGTASLVFTGATSINDEGQIAGYVNPVTMAYSAFLRQSDGTFIVFAPVPFCSGTNASVQGVSRPTLWPVLDSVEGIAPTGINDRGEITGVCGPGAGISEGFLRRPNGAIIRFAVAGDVPNPVTRARAINPRGQIAGYFLDAERDFHGFLRKPDGTITTFAASDSGDTITTAINPRGQITGYADHGFLRQSDGSIVTFDPVGSIFTQPIGINPRGEITGTYLDSNNVSHGFLREASGCITTIDVPNASGTYPTGINARGDITGWYSDMSGVHGFVRSR